MQVENTGTAKGGSPRIRSILLPLIAVALVAYYMIFEYRRQPTPQAPPPVRNLFPNLVPELITKVKIASEEKTLVLSKVQRQFEIEEPHPAPANQVETARLLSIISGAKYERAVPLENLGRDLSEFGLAEPRLALTVWTKNLKGTQPEVRTVRFGWQAPSGAHVYAIAAGSQDLLLINAEVVNQIDYFLFVPPFKRSGITDS